MVEHCSRKGRRIVAGIAGRRSGNVVYRFSDCCGAVVAACAGADDLAVIHRDRGRPSGGQMTCFANRSCRNMRIRLANGTSAVMTARAVLDNTGVIKSGCAPIDCVVAGVACVHCRNMGGRSSGRDCAVVAAFARTNDLSMIYRGNRCPCGGGMTGIAGVGC